LYFYIYSFQVTPGITIIDDNPHNSTFPVDIKHKAPRHQPSPYDIAHMSHPNAPLPAQTVLNRGQTHWASNVPVYGIAHNPSRRRLQIDPGEYYRDMWRR
jgi:hypothetical protein